MATAFRPVKTNIYFSTQGHKPYIYIYAYDFIIININKLEGSLEVKFPTIWAGDKAEVGRVKEEKRSCKKVREEKESEERRCRCAKG